MTALSDHPPMEVRGPTSQPMAIASIRSMCGGFGPGRGCDVERSGAVQLYPRHNYQTGAVRQLEVTLRLVKRTLDQIDPPVGVVDLLREGLPVDEVLDAAQGAPAYPTAPSIVERVREVAGHDDGGRYTDGRGLPALRAALAEDLNQDYGAEVSLEDVLITAGSNQAFCLAASADTAASRLWATIVSCII